MDNWLALQRKMAKAVRRREGDASFEAHIVSDALTAEERLQVYRNNFTETLSASLVSVFPVVEAFVGRLFLQQMFKQYCRENPPQAPILHAYGAGVAAFLRHHPQAASVPYIGDVAALEWATHELMTVDEQTCCVDVEAAFQAAKQRRLRLCENARLIRSSYPLYDLWRVATGQIEPEGVDADSGGQSVLVTLQDMEIRYHLLDKGQESAVPSILGEGGWPVNAREVIEQLVKLGAAEIAANGEV